MKAVFVLFADHTVQNFTRRVVFELNTRYHAPLNAARLPAHVSLKQPFAFESMPALETYFDAFAARTAPVDITLSRFTYGEWNGSGILGLDVVETPALRALHDQLNQELPTVVADARAPFDGSAYHFHLTVEMSSTAVGGGLKAYFDGLPSPVVNLSLRARWLGLFYSRADGGADDPYITYRVCPLAGSAGG